MFDILDLILNRATSSAYSFETKAAEIEPPKYRFMAWQLPHMPEIATAFLVAGNILILIFAFCGNSAAVIVCLRSKFPRPATKFYLISLAISDFVHAALLTVSSLGFLTDKYQSWILGEFLCTITDFVLQWTMLTNCCCLIAIAIDRYWAVVRGLKPACLSPRIAKVLSCLAMACVWIVPMGLSVQLLTYYKWESYWVYDYDGEEVVSDNRTSYLCWKPNFDRKFDMIYYIVLGCFFTALLTVFLFSYISILVFVQRNFRRIPGDHNPTSAGGTEQNNRRTGGASCPKRRNRRTAHVLAVLICIFLATRLPLWIFNILIFVDQSTFGETEDSYLVIQRSLQLLSCLKSAINPFIYVIWNDALRSASNGVNNAHQGSKRLGCCGSADSFQQISMKRLWRNFRGKTPTSYDFTGQSRIMPASTCTQRYFTSDKNETGLKTTTVEPSYIHTTGSVP